MKFILSTQGASPAGFSFSPLNVRECFFGQRSYAGFFSYLCALPGYTVYTYIFFLKSTSPSSRPPPAASEIVRPTNRGISHVSYFLCHATCAPRSSSGHMYVLRIRNFVTHAGLMPAGKWSLLKIRGQ